MKYYEEKLPFRGRYHVFPKIYRRERHVLVSGFIETLARPQGSRHREPLTFGFASVREPLMSFLGPLTTRFFFERRFTFPVGSHLWSSEALEERMRIFREIFEKIKSPTGILQNSIRVYRKSSVPP